MVPLTHWSDVVFLQYDELCTRSIDDVEVKGLKYVVRNQIDTPETTDMVFEACNRHGNQYKMGVHGPPMFAERWILKPDSNVESERSAFYAILSTPHGAGVTFLLAEHKDRMGRKTIKSISVSSEQYWRTRRNYEECKPTLVFEIGDAPKLEAGDQPEGNEVDSGH